MEVHAHAHTARKKWTHYFWEFLKLFLAIFTGERRGVASVQYKPCRWHSSQITALSIGPKSDVIKTNRAYGSAVSE